MSLAPEPQSSSTHPASVEASVPAPKTSRSVNPSLVIGAVLVVVILAVSVLAPYLSPYGPNQVDYSAVLQPPSAHHWFGTDQLGRDQLARILYGARTSMEVSVGALVVGAGIGVPVGLVAGYFRGFLDTWLIMRIIDAIQAFPFLILALVLAAMLGPGSRNAMIAIGIGLVPTFARTARAQMLQELGKDYIDAARVVGCTHARIIFRHILPNALTPIIVQATLAMASSIVAEASLEYLGLGVQPPTASWGSMLQSAQGYLQLAPWLVLFPGLALVFSVVAFNFLGDGVQRWLNRRLS
ncbi:ABC transporter permease [Alicyclobacillus vulcanalis]|uniref:Peptide/nickel transport system permease protein n=1 Tax=Alicyclobacillus vulcanalis TaxID=252246 RepID=A0A1N7MF87_9BACL|nr:ABC transporter permease [Alicyclobacillus vulcanalis]SIS84786.1 peptide/nickel transport system permease protein [Alicyclobacillus vulcanalis]